MTEIAYKLAELSNLKYTKITYIGLDKKPHEIKTEIKFIGEALISLFFRCRHNFEIQCPQEVTIKFVTDVGLFIAKSTLRETKQDGSFVYFNILPPAKMEQRQNRKYYRINIRRDCILIATEENGNSKSFLSRVVDLSAGGLLIHKLESMFSNKYVTIEPSNYKYFNVVLFLDIDIVLKLSARFVRQEKGEDSDRYAFEFVKMKQCDIDTISKYVTREQVEQLKLKRHLL